jgi:hypothetical protein
MCRDRLLNYVDCEQKCDRHGKEKNKALLAFFMALLASNGTLAGTCTRKEGRK